MKGPDGKVLEDSPIVRIGKYDNHKLGETDIFDNGIHRIDMYQVIFTPLEAVLVLCVNISIASRKLPKSLVVTPHMEKSASDVPSQYQIQSVCNKRIIYEYKKVQMSGVGNFLAQEITLTFGCWVKMWTVLVMGTKIVIIVIIGVSLGIKGKSINTDSPSTVLSAVRRNHKEALQELSINISGIQALSKISSPQSGNLL